jgi:hypothetical protein
MSLSTLSTARAYTQQVPGSKTQGQPKKGVQNEVAALLEELGQVIQQNMLKALPKGPQQPVPKSGAKTGSNLLATNRPVVQPEAQGTQKTAVPKGSSKTTGAQATTAVVEKKGPSKVNTAQFGALQLPSGSPGRPDTIHGRQLDNYESKFFDRRADGAITFKVPKGGGVTTPNSSYPRSELAEGKTWNMSKGPHELGATLSVDKLPPNGNVVIGQIHQKRSDGKPPRPPVELHYVNGQVYATVMSKNAERGQYTRKKIVLAENIKPGEKFSYDMKMNSNGKVDLTVNGKTKSVALDSSFKNTDFYFKAGNYCQDPKGGSEVTFNNLGIKH